jgi:SIR2-like domain
MFKRRHQAPEPHPDLLQEISSGNVIPFVGAGFSKSAEPKESSALKEFVGMPTYAELLERLLEKANLKSEIKKVARIYLNLRDSSKPDHYDEAAEVIRKEIGGKLRFFLAIRDIIEPIDEEIKGSLAHKFLGLLGFRRIVTTNYDRLLEGFAAPRHEVITPDDDMAIALFFDDKKRSSILKLHGDITRPNNIPWGKSGLLRGYGYDTYNDPLKAIEPSASTRLEILKRMFWENTILFLGTSLAPSEGFSQVLMNLVRDQKGGLPHRHYALIPFDSKLEAFRDSLASQMNIEIQYYRPDAKHSQVWEYLSLLKAGRPKVEKKPGREWQQWYLQKERSDYLLTQLEREESATSVRYLTPKLTNAIATVDYLEVDCRDELKGRYKPKIIESTLKAMTQRASNLERRLQRDGLEVRILFLEQELRKSLDQSSVHKDKLGRAVERYKHLLGLTKATDLEVRVVPGLTSDELKRREASFALIFNRIDGQPAADVTIAYSSQATNDFPEIHMVQINTPEIWQHTFTFEQFWAAAKNEEETSLLIQNLIDKVSIR